MLGQFYSSYSVPSTQKYLYGFMLLFSICCGSIIPIVYRQSKNFRHHPSQIILILCLLEMIRVYQVFMESVCLGELINFLTDILGYRDILIYYSWGSLRKEDIYITVCKANQSVIVISVLCQLNYYIVLTVDLIITLKRPFLNMKKRIYLYHICSSKYWSNIVSSTLIAYFATNEYLTDLCKDPGCRSLSRFLVTPNAVIALVSLLTILFIVTVYLGIVDQIKCKNLDPAIKQNRKTYFINHLIIMSSLYLIWIVPLVNNFRDQQDDSTFVEVYFCIMLMHPIIFLIIRLREPYFRVRIKHTLLEFFGFQKKTHSEDYITQDQQWMVPLGQLIQVQTNQETVANILTSILKIVDYQETGILQDIRKSCGEKRRMTVTNRESSTDYKSPLLASVNMSLKFTMDYDIIEHAPGIFQQLRLTDGLNFTKFQNSLRLDRNVTQIRKTQESLGKSGSFFFFSYDRKLLLKTIDANEKTFILNFLPEYVKHINNNHQSLLARLYGLFTLNIQGLSSIHLILMENTLKQLSEDITVYDLKGSLADRKADIQNQQVEDILTSRFSQKIPQVLKDINLMQSEDVFIQLSAEHRKELFRQLVIDIQFLGCNQIMDYSMLLGIQHSTAGITDFNVRRLDNKHKTYSFGIIDYTSQFTLNKRLENIYKQLLKRTQFSCVDPEMYVQRIYAFLNSMIIIHHS